MPSIEDQSGSEANSHLVHEFEGVYEQMRAHVTGRDRNGLGEMLSPGYTFTSPDGQRMQRDEVLDLEMRIPPPTDVGGFSVQQVTEEVVVVRGQDVVKGNFPAGSISDDLATSMRSGVRIVFTSVWRRHQDGWQMVSNDAHVDVSFGGTV